MRGLRDQSTQPPWTAQHPAVHGKPCRAMGLVPARTLGQPARVPTCTHTFVGPNCATTGLHHLVHRAICFELLLHVSLSGLCLDYFWARWTPFVILNLVVSSI